MVWPRRQYSLVPVFRRHAPRANESVYHVRAEVSNVNPWNWSALPRQRCRNGLKYMNFQFHFKQRRFCKSRLVRDLIFHKAERVLT